MVDVNVFMSWNQPLSSVIQVSSHGIIYFGKCPSVPLYCSESWGKKRQQDDTFQYPKFHGPLTLENQVPQPYHKVFQSFNLLKIVFCYWWTWALYMRIVLQIHIHTTCEHTTDTCFLLITWSPCSSWSPQCLWYAKI